MKIRKGDNVLVTTGREKGKTGRVLRVSPSENRVWIEHTNMVKRHRKPRGPQAPGGIVEKEAPIHVSNVMVISEKTGKPVRVGRKVLDDGRRVRWVHKNEEQIDS